MDTYKIISERTLSKTLFYIVFIASIFSVVSCNFLPQNLISISPFSVTSLKVEYSETPLGIDVQKPRFSWQMNAPGIKRDCTQTAFQIVVKNPEDVVMWDTKKVIGSDSVGIQYEGSLLNATTKYKWMVTVWNQNGDKVSESSWFETGLMNANPDLSAWDSAKWIGGGNEDLVFYSHYLSVFKMQYTLQIDPSSNSTKAGFILGANDYRLLDKNMNLFNIESRKDETYIKLELDVSGVDGSETGLAKLNIYRVGYAPDDSATVPFQSFDILNSVINNENKYDKHQFQVGSVFGQISITLDGNDSFTSSSVAGRGGFGGGFGGRRGGAGVSLNLNPVGSGGDYISFPMLADIGFCVEAGQKAHFSDVAVMHYRSPSNKIFQEDLAASVYNGIYADSKGLSVEGQAYTITGGSDGSFIVADPSSNAMPMLRTEFAANRGAIKKARLYVTARGVYEIYINGKRVGDDYFNPGLTQYNITHMYQTYDVTDMIIKNSDNAIGAWLGEGWWSGNYTFTGSNWNYFGDRQSLLAKLIITYHDGTNQIITTNDKDWKYYNDSPVVYGNFFQGEAYDARKEKAIKNWSTASYDDSKWKQAVEVPLEGTAFLGNMGGGNFGGRSGGTGSFNYDNMSLIGQIGENAGIVKTLTAQSVDEIRPGVFVYDMGQNMVGIPRISITGAEEGDIIRLRYAEMLYPDMPEYGDNAGMVMLENLRAAHVQDTYIAKKGSNIIQPRFTFHGYRYIEITGIDKALPLDKVNGLVISSIRTMSAAYETSNNKVNRLWQNIVWSQYGNFLSIPTDCPQRNERMGWLGDISVFSRTSTYLANVDQFFRRHMFAMRDTQSEQGRFSDVAPVGGGFGGVLWGSAGITIPWEAFQQYNDIGLLEEHYDAMVKYVDYIATTTDPQTGISSDSTLGDWLGPQVNATPNQLLTSEYYVYDLWIVAKAAEILGKTEDVQKYRAMYEESKEKFHNTFVNEDNQTVRPASFGGRGSRRGFGGRGNDTAANDGSPQLIDTQTSYAVGLALNVFDEDRAPDFAKRLAEAVERQNVDDNGVTRPKYSLMTGFIGTAWVSKALSDYGYSDLAYKLLQNNQYPSWLYAIDQGATTIWERLNGYTVENGFGGNNSMNSFNHYSFGAVGQWMMAYSVGIQRDEPGFKKFILQPEPDPTGEMTWAEGYYDSMYGRIKSAWKVNGDKLTFSVTVPANTTATLYLPTTSKNYVTERGVQADEAKGVTYIKYEKGKAVYELKSGSYKFVSNLK